MAKSAPLNVGWDPSNLDPIIAHPLGEEVDYHRSRTSGRFLTDSDDAATM